MSPKEATRWRRRKERVLFTYLSKMSLSDFSFVLIYTIVYTFYTRTIYKIYTERKKMVASTIIYSHFFGSIINLYKINNNCKKSYRNADYKKAIFNNQI